MTIDEKELERVIENVLYRVLKRELAREYTNEISKRLLLGIDKLEKETTSATTRE